MFENYYEINLQDWDPCLIVEDTADLSGQAIDATYWNSLWNKHKTQGDYNSRTIYEMLAKLNNTIWNAEDGLAQIAHPTTVIAAGDNASAQLTWCINTIEHVRPVVDDADGARYVQVDSFTPVTTATAVAFPPEKNTAALLKYLKQLHEELAKDVEDISAGTIGAFKHNDISARDVAGAHPASAIQFTQMDTDLETWGTNVQDLVLDHITTNAVPKHLATEIRANYRDQTINVQSAINNLILELAQATGDIQGLTIYHKDLPDTKTNGHPASAITQDGQPITNYFQRKVLVGTGVPNAELGQDGDIYIQIA